MSGHTPGNWLVRGSTVLIPLGENSIAEVYAGTPEIARLIAAAPEMLAALEETWRVIEAAGLHNLARGVQLGQVSWFVKASDARSVSNAAIAKAEGRQ